MVSDFITSAAYAVPASITKLIFRSYIRWFTGNWWSLLPNSAVKHKALEPGANRLIFPRLKSNRNNQ
ncbi:hypothetical protein J2X72_001523 [Phyllobacterium sp. 1468]|nr:hypothetical protein [Phyllobacterium sp. 1468]